MPFTPNLVPSHQLQARQTEASLQLLRRGARQRGAGAADTSDNISDNLSDKICAQLFLDVQVLLNLHVVESCCCTIFKSRPLYVLDDLNLLCVVKNAKKTPSSSLWLYLNLLFP
jgi:hypothetical protein